MLDHIPGLPDLILFWMNDASVIRVSRCGITRGTLSSKYVLTLIWMIMTGGSFKIVSNWRFSQGVARQLHWAASMRSPVMLLWAAGALALAAAALLAAAPAAVFYLPGVAPNDFQKVPLPS